MISTFLLLPIIVLTTLFASGQGSIVYNLKLSPSKLSRKVFVNNPSDQGQVLILSGFQYFSSFSILQLTKDRVVPNSTTLNVFYYQYYLIIIHRFFQKYFFYY